MKSTAIAALFALSLAGGASPVKADIGLTAFKQSLAAEASVDEGVAKFYRENGYQPIWTVDDEAARERRAALFAAIERAPIHGLPERRYDADALKAELSGLRTQADLARAEAAMSKAFVTLAHDMQSGILTPSKVVPAIKREISVTDGDKLLARLVEGTPNSFFREIVPQSPEYARLMREKIRLEKIIETGGWGPTVSAGSLKPGQSGRAVIQLRNRLMAMGFIDRSASGSYDAPLQKAVQSFQKSVGLKDDGVAGDATILAINTSPQDRLKSVIVAMERERWFGQPERGERHVWVNLTDFTARIVDKDTVTFESRSVIGANRSDRRSPEFSDTMEHMVINPTWNVPRSIAVKEYLPQMQRNRNAAGHLNLVDSRGRVVPRSAINFGAYNARTFPFAIKQPPSKSNALGLVKFMFPNKYNIYLHDTPSKHLFDHEVRAYSHGCIRLGSPFEFAYALLAAQQDDPVGYFHSILDTGRETVVELDQPIPVHLIYRTAFGDSKGPMNYRADIYGRDAMIWQALEQAGVELPRIQG